MIEAGTQLLRQALGGSHLGLSLGPVKYLRCVWDLHEAGDEKVHLTRVQFSA